MPAIPSVSVVIPVWNAEAYLPTLLPRILEQEGVCVREILLLDSCSRDRTVEIAESFEKVRVLTETNFSHGGTRNRGIEAAREDRVLLMTQDALPLNRQVFLPLVAAIKDPSVAYAFSRQIPYPGTNPMECYYLEDRFPANTPLRFESHGNSIESPEQTFCSNVCAIIRKSAWRDHPFREDLIMGEDQQFSKQVQEDGFAVVYVPDSVVEHSHNYTLAQTFRRYFDSVVAITQTLPRHGLSNSALTGISFLKKELGYLLRKAPWWFPYYLLYLGVKTLATILAHRADRLPPRLRSACSLHRAYWRREAGE